MRANGLHREAAFLSNRLHEFRDDDVAAAKEVVDRIVAVRADWKQAMKQVEYVRKTGQLPEEVPTKRTVADAGQVLPSGVAELRMEMGRLSVNISKYRKKLEQQPRHRKAEQWTADLDKMEALKDELKTKIVELSYATT